MRAWRFPIGRAPTATTCFSTRGRPGLAGPWDLFIEHGHRLLGAGGLDCHRVGGGNLDVRYDRRWLRWLVVGALALVILQGTLGGLRVLRDDRRIAQIHGCVGPSFFALSVMIAAFTSRWWRSVGQPDAGEKEIASLRRGVGELRTMTWITFALAALQLVLGSQLRHGIEYLPASVFRMSVAAHVIGALLLTLQILWLSWKVWRTWGVATVPGQKLRRPVSWLLVLVVCQLILGIATWTAKFGWPHMLQSFLSLPGYIVQAESMRQSLIVTAHVALGTLILAVSGLVAVRCTRLASGSYTVRATARKSSARPVGVGV